MVPGAGSESRGWGGRVVESGTIVNAAYWLARGVGDELKFGSFLDKSLGGGK